MSFSPLRALKHPAWIAALVVLAANDHLLKGSGLLPGWITGKASDFAGLFVAPALLALLLRARSRRTVAIAHAVIALGFAAVKVWPAATHACEAALSLVVKSRMWTDPTDLVALPMVLLSWIVLAPRMSAAPAASTAPTSIAERALAAFGAVACFATSAPYEPPVYGPGGPGLRNDSGKPITIEIKRLDSGTTANATELAASTSLPLDPETATSSPWETRTVAAAEVVAFGQDTSATSYGYGQLPTAGAFVRFPASKQTFLIVRPAPESSGQIYGYDGVSGSTASMLVDSKGEVSITAPSTTFAVVVQPIDGAALCGGAAPAAGVIEWQAAKLDPEQNYEVSRIDAQPTGGMILGLKASKTGQVTPVSVTLPDGAMPFVLGETVWADTVGNDSIVLRSILTGVSLEIVTFASASDVTARDLAGNQVVPRSDPSCFDRSACGALSRRLMLSVTTPRGTLAKVRSGQALEIEAEDGSAVTMWVGASPTPAFSSRSCNASSSVGGRVGAAAITRPKR